MYIYIYYHAGMKYLTTLYSFRHICHFLPMILLTPPQYKSSLTTIYFVPSHLPHFCWGAFLTPLPYQTHLLTHPHQTPRVHFNSESFQFCPRRPRLCATHAVSAATLAVLKVASRKSGKKKNLKSGQPFTSRKRAAKKQNKNAQHSKKSGKK